MAHKTVLPTRSKQPNCFKRAHRLIDTLAYLHGKASTATKRIPRKQAILLFPVLVCICLLTLTALRISGSSIGVYPQLTGEPDTHMLAGNPRGVRSDEWLVTTQMTVAQAANGYKKINNNIAQGQNMSLLDVPIRDWLTIFKPQNLSFLILPLEYAFAFKWWLLIATLLIACYFFVLEIFPGNLLRATLVALFVGLSPMVFWWWASGVILMLAYSFLIPLFVLRLLQEKNKARRIAYTAAISYVLTCFGLLLYPPFQIPCILTVAVFLLGWGLQHYRTKKDLVSLLHMWPYLLLIVVTPLLIGLAFYQTNKAVINSTTHTLYPGMRIIPSGGVEPLLAVSSFLSPNLEYDQKAASGYLGNQSEASTFIFIAPYLFIPSLYIVFQERRRNKQILWGLLIVNIFLAILLARMYLTTPWLDPVYRILLFDKVPGMRLLIGLGLAGIFQLLLLMKALDSIVLKRAESRMLAIGASATSLLVMLYVGRYTIHTYPIFISSFGKVALLALWIACAIYLLLRKHFIWGTALLVAFSFLSVYRIHPLYQGLSPVTSSKTIQTIKQYPDTGSWVVLDDRLLINFPLMANKKSLSGVQFAPQIKLWEQLDPQHTHEEVYNRYAHVLFVNDDTMQDPLALKYADMFVVKFDPCTTFMQKNATYVLSPKLLTSTCVKYDQTITLPAKDLYIYKIIHPAT